MTAIQIVGASIAGLTLAATLKRSDWDVTLYDDRLGSSGLGTALGMWPSAMRALETIGVASAIRDRGVHLSGAVLRDRHGEVLRRLTNQDVWLVTRPDLLGVLREAVLGDVPARTRGVLTTPRR